MHLVCGVRQDARKYLYKGSSLNASQLKIILKSEGNEKRCWKRNIRYFRRVNDYESLDGLFAEIKDELIEKNVAERLWELFDELLQVVVSSIAKSGLLDILEFRNSVEYEYLEAEKQGFRGVDNFRCAISLVHSSVRQFTQATLKVVDIFHIVY